MSDTELVWSLIGQCVGFPMSIRAGELGNRLRGMNVVDLERFVQGVRELLGAAYTEELWGAAHVIWGGCSDDGFDDFLGWLILQGKEVYEASLRDPDSLVDVEGVEESSLEGLTALAVDIFRQRTGRAVSGQRVRPRILPGLAARFANEVEMQRRYPRLSERFDEEV